MSHELRPPHNAIVGFSEVLATNDLSPEERRNYANVMQANADLFLKLVNDIIDFSLFDSCDIELNKERVELTGLILDLYNQYVALLSRKSG
jgi:signal transduction histidine kinase